MMSTSTAPGDIPGYWRAPLDAAARKLAARAASGARIGLFFFTDLHVAANHGRSGALIAALARMTGIRTALCGGDFTPAFADGFPSDRAALDDAADGYRRLWVEPLAAAGVTLLTAKGNHDFTIRHALDSDEGCAFSAEETRQVILGSCAPATQCAGPGDPDACCFFRDDPASRVRFIVADTTDSRTTARRYWSLIDGMREPQLLWLASTAFGSVPPGWDIVVMQHIPVAGCAAKPEDATLFAPFRTLLEAYQNRATWRLGNRAFDFSAATGHIVLDLCGHHHAEREAFSGGILHAMGPCDAAYDDYAFGSPLCGTLPRKEPGTPYEQTFDCVQLDPARSLAHFTRIGGGQDKTIHTLATAIAPGETRRLEAPHLRGPVTWTAYDSDAFIARDNPANRWSKLISYRSTRVEIAPDGLARRLLPGPAMAVALDGSLNKEIFPLV